MIAVGLDLSGKAENPSGFCTLHYNDREFSNFKEFLEGIDKIIVGNINLNDEIIQKIKEVNPIMTAIDAPFSIAKQQWRTSEIDLLKKGFRPISTQLANMRILADRAIEINSQLIGYRKIETFSRAVEKMLGIDKNYFIDLMKDKIEKTGKWERGKISKDQYDAMLCAILAIYHLSGKTEILGNKLDATDHIVLPKIF